MNGRIPLKITPVSNILQNYTYFPIYQNLIQQLIRYFYNQPQ